MTADFQGCRQRQSKQKLMPKMEMSFRSTKEEAAQFSVLTKHFFLRLFLNDVVAFEEQMKERVIGILAILAIFSGLLAHVLLVRYLYVPDQGTSWIETCAFMTYCMLMTGLVAALEWQVMFPDARDYLNLYPLPVKARTLLAAKFTSLSLFVGLFALGLNTLSIPMFVLLIPRWQSSSLLYGLQFALVHVLCMFLACFFAFFLNIVIIGVLLALAGYRLFSRVSAYIRSCLLVVQALLFFLYMRGLFFGFANLIPMDELEASQLDIKYLYNIFPPFWFTDLYETLLGHENLPFHGTLLIALAGLLLMVGTFCATAGLSYKHFFREQGAGQKRRTSLQRMSLIMTNAFDEVFLKNSTQRAVFHFYLRTLKINMSLKMRLASYLALGVGIIPFLIAVKDLVPKTLAGISRATLSIPLILSFFFLLGLRGIVNIPVSLEANWVFRLTEIKKIRHYFTGLRKAIIFLNILPLFALLFVFYAIIWNPRTALYHCLYGLAVSLLVMEALFLNFCKIPFSCSYLPGKEKVQQFWLFYLISFLAYINLMSWVELELLRRPGYFLMFFGIVFFIIAAGRLYQILFFYKNIGVKYEEAPEPVMVDLDYETPLHRKNIPLR
jgi:hypothetical protein